MKETNSISVKIIPFFMFFIFLAGIARPIQAQTWTELDSFQGPPRHHPVTFSYKDKGYLLTGVSDNDYLSDFYQFDASDSTWSKLDDFPGQARGYSYAVVSVNKAYIGFGIGEDDYLDDLWEYDLDAEKWSQKQSCPCVGRAHPAFLQLDNKIYVGLGNGIASSGFIQNFQDWWVYDIDLDRWEEKSSFIGEPRHHPYYFTVDTFLYVGFGHGIDIYNDFYRYNPRTDQWLEMKKFPGEGRVAGTQFAYDGRGYILSGQDSQHDFMPSGEFWEYTPETDSWKELTAHPGQSRWAPGTFIIDGIVYLSAGDSPLGIAPATSNNDLWSFRLGPNPASTRQLNLDISLKPNPAKEFIEFDLENINAFKYRIFDSKGRSVQEGFVNKDKINIQSLSDGLFILHLFNSNRSGYQRFIHINN